MKLLVTGGAGFIGSNFIHYMCEVHPEYEIIDKIVTQSSDREFHCLTVTLFYQTNRG